MPLSFALTASRNFPNSAAAVFSFGPKPGTQPNAFAAPLIMAPTKPRNLSTTNANAVRAPLLSASQCFATRTTARPIGPVRIPSRRGQLPLIQFHTAEIAPVTFLNAPTAKSRTAPNTPLTMFRNVSDFLYAYTRPAARPTKASTTTAIGFSDMTTFSAACTAVYALVTPLTTPRVALYSRIAPMIAPTPTATDRTTVPLSFRNPVKLFSAGPTSLAIVLPRPITGGAIFLNAPTRFVPTSTTRGLKTETRFCTAGITLVTNWFLTKPANSPSFGRIVPVMNPPNSLSRGRTEVWKMPNAVRATTPIRSITPTNPLLVTSPSRNAAPSAENPVDALLIAVGTMRSRMVAALLTTGRNAPPIASFALPTITPSFCRGSDAAAAAPPNSLFNSPRMIFWACIVLPESTRVLICFFWSAVKLTPTFCRAVTPLMGSFSALPRRMLEGLAPSVVAWASLRAAVMSVTAWVAWSKMAFPLPTPFLMLVNVSSRFSPDCTASSSAPVLLLIAVARLPT